MRRILSTCMNMQLARQCKQKIDKFFANEFARDGSRGHWTTPHSLLPMAHMNHLGEVSKRTPGKYRMIVDLSFPEGHSPNDRNLGLLCSLAYTSVEDAVESVLRLGRDTLMAKMDICSAYRNILVHPDDRWLVKMTAGSSG